MRTPEPRQEVLSPFEERGQECRECGRLVHGELVYLDECGRIVCQDCEDLELVA